MIALPLGMARAIVPYALCGTAGEGTLAVMVLVMVLVVADIGPGCD